MSDKNFLEILDREIEMYHRLFLVYQNLAETEGGKELKKIDIDVAGRYMTKISALLALKSKLYKEKES